MKQALINAHVVTHESREPIRGPIDLNTPTEIVDGAIIFEDGVIKAIGRTAILEPELNTCDEVTSVGGRLVTPGLIDCHSHLVFGGHRADEFEAKCLGATYQQIAATGGGIRSSVAATRAESEESLLASATRRAHWAISCGTTTLEVKSGYGLDLETESKMLRCAGQLTATGLTISRTFLGLHAVPPEAPNADDYAQAVVDHHVGKIAQQKLATSVDAFIEEGYFNPIHAKELARVANQYGLSLRLHVDQFSDSGGARLAAALGARSADHLECTEDDGLKALAHSDTIAVLLPTSVIGLGRDRYARGRDLVKMGAIVAIASDFNPGSSPSPSLPFAMSLACLQMRMSASEALAATTINAAAVLGLQETKGTLERGKDADLVVWEAQSIAEIPYWIAAPIVYQTWATGKMLYQK